MSAARWSHKVLLGDVFHNDDLTLADKSGAIAARMSRFEDDYLNDLLDELRDAGNVNDVKWFDAVWDAVYDWADDQRVWIDTFAGVTA